MRFLACALLLAASARPGRAQVPPVSGAPVGEARLLDLPSSLTLERRGDTYFVFKDDAKEPDLAIRREGKAYFVIGPGGDWKFPAFSVGFQQPVSERCSLGFEHHNEGHPANDPAKDHRDDMLLTGTCALRVGSAGTSVEAGPAIGAAFNTVRRDGREYDDHGLARGLILAVTQELGRSGWSARAQYEYLSVQDSFATKQLMLGLEYMGRGEAPADFASDVRQRIGVAAGNVVPNGGGGVGHAGGELMYERWISRAVSVELDLMHEGDGGTTRRDDACVQARYNFELSEKWSAAAGAGPCAAQELAATRRGTELAGRVTFDVDRKVAAKDSVGFRMTRTAPVSSGTAQDTDAFFVTFKRDL